MAHEFSRQVVSYGLSRQNRFLATLGQSMVTGTERVLHPNTHENTGNKKLRGFCQHRSFILVGEEERGNFCVSNDLFDSSLLILSIHFLKEYLEDNFFRLDSTADLFQSSNQKRMLEINLSMERFDGQIHVHHKLLKHRSRNHQKHIFFLPEQPFKFQPEFNQII